MDEKGFVVPDGKYWLGDADYLISDHLLILYKGVSYHFKKILPALQKPNNTKELFNLRHSSLRNIIEHIIGETIRNTYSNMAGMMMRDLIDNCLAGIESITFLF